MQKRKFILILMCLLTGVLLVPQMAHASCTMHSDGIGFGGPTYVSVNGSLTVPSGTNYPIYIGTANAFYTPAPTKFICNQFYEYKTLSPGIYSQPSGYTTFFSATRSATIYKTNVPGIGIAISDGTYAASQTYSFYVDHASQVGGASVWLYGGGFAGFYKIGEITGDNLTVNPGTILNEGVSGAGTPFSVALVGGVTFVPDNPTCTIIGTDVDKSVTLQTVKSSDFNSSPGAGDVSFTLTAGNCRNATSAVFTFSGTADATNPVLFKNTGTATGVGVRIYPASNSSQTIGANGTNNVQTVQVSSGQAVLSLGAQYYKTGTSVGAGQVTARATVTMSYN